MESLPFLCIIPKSGRQEQSPICLAFVNWQIYNKNLLHFNKIQNRRVDNDRVVVSMMSQGKKKEMVNQGQRRQSPGNREL